MRLTHTYSHDLFLRSEKLLTLKEYVQYGRLKPGHCLLIGDVDDKGVSKNTKTIWIGDATPFMMPSNLDGGIGWDWSHPMMQKFVIEIHEFSD